MINSEKIKNAPKRSRRTKLKQQKGKQPNPLHRLNKRISLDKTINSLNDIKNIDKLKPAQKDEFAKNKITGHPSYIYISVDKLYIYKNITKNPLHDVVYIKLNKNPNPQMPNEQSFITVGSYVERKENFKSKKLYKDWKLSPQDKKEVKKTFVKK